jgi:DNA-binding transcriptional LysR family regulator
MFTLDQIRCFVAVAEELHFGRAAERLNMTQPPLSRQIQKLERALQLSLLERDHRSVRLTTAGEAFLRESRDLLAAAERAPVTARQVASGYEGVVRIGFTASAGYGILGSILEQFSSALPHVQLELSEMVTHQQTEGIASGALDLGLARPPFDSVALASLPLVAEDLLLAVPDDHPLTRATPSGEATVSDAEFHSLPLIMHSPVNARYFYDLVMHLFPVRPGQVVHTVDQITTMIALVRAQRGVALVPASATFLNVDGVAFVPLGERARGVVEMHAIWGRDNSNPALDRALAALRSMSPLERRS